MPNTNSARKSLRVGIRRNGENRRIKADVRQVVKKASSETLSEVFSTLDKAAKKNVIHPNKAARLKSRISARVEKLTDEEKKTAKTVRTTAKKSAAKKTAVKAKAIKAKTTSKTTKK